MNPAMFSYLHSHQFIVIIAYTASFQYALGVHPMQSFLSTSRHMRLDLIANDFFII